jgi:hypothetical protein
MLRAILAQIQGIRPRNFYHSEHQRNVSLPCPLSPHSALSSDDSSEFFVNIDIPLFLVYVYKQSVVPPGNAHQEEDQHG